MMNYLQLYVTRPKKIANLLQIDYHNTPLYAT